MKRILFILAALLPLSVFAQDIKVSAPNLVAADEQFKITFSIEGEGKPSDFNWNSGNDFQLVWGPQKGFSSSTSIVNGKVSSSSTSTYTYILMPKAAGKFTLPAATAKVKGNTISSTPITLEVVSGGAAAGAQQGGQQSSQPQQSQSQSQVGQVSGDDLYMRLMLSSNSAVVGQPVTATIKLFQRVDIAGFDDAKFPSFNGFWSQDITPQGDIHFTREKVGEQIYNTAVIRRYVIIPQMAGDLTIDPSELVCRIYQKVPSRGNSIFDGFFDDYTTIRKRITTPATRLHVTALPGGAPASFGGGVGEFSISAKLNKDSFSTHEAGSLIVTVSGRGNVALLEAPKINFPPDFEVYDTKVTENVDKASGSTTGSKTYEYPFIPRSHGDFEIEPVQYSYYDISKGKYVTLETEAIPFTVLRGNDSDATSGSAQGVVVPGVAKKGVKNLGEDIRYINTKKPSLSAKGDFFAGSGLFWTLMAILAAAAAATWAVLRSLYSRRADVVGTKTRKATKMAMKRLKLTETFLQQNLYTAFYEELHKALLGFVSDKLNMPATDLSKDNIAERLTAGGADAATVASFIEVLDACEYARYAPNAGHDAMQAHYQKAIDTISSIDSSMKKNNTQKGAMAVIIAMLMMLPLSASAQQSDYIETQWENAGKAYAEGRWSEALEGWHAIDEAGLQSPELYYNIGNAWYKSESYAKAILYYERALKLDPSYSDARYNLEVAKAFVQDDIEPVPEFVLKTWWRKLCYVTDSTAWAVLTIFFFALTLAMVLLFLLAPASTGKKVGFFTGIAALLLTVMALNFSIQQKRDWFEADSAIVMRPVAPVKSSPSSESSSDLFVLHEGTKVQILDNVAEWTNIELADGRQGWIRTESLEVI